MGLFMPEKIQSKVGKITFTAYDRMMWLSPEYVSALPEDTDTVSVLSEISKNTSVPIVKSDLIPIPIKRPVDITYRDALSYIAQLYGCFANVSREGVVEFHAWIDTGHTLTADQGISGFESSGTFTVEMMQVNNDGAVLSAGSGGKGIVFDNPFMTQALLNDVFQKWSGFSYNPVKCPVILGDPRLDPWDLITVVDATGEEYRVPIMALTYNYDGGLSMEIASTIADTSDTEFDYKSPYTIFKENAAKRLREAKEAAFTAEGKADNALKEANNAQSVADSAKLAVTTAQESANQAQTAAEEARSLVDQVEKDVESLETTIEQANVAAQQAQKAAETAETKASEAKESVINAEKEAQVAKESSILAAEKADTALEKANTAQGTAELAKSEAESAQETAAAAKLDAEQAQKDIDALDGNLTTLKNTMSVEYARKTDLTESEARLQTQITQNAGEISSTATKMQKIDETANNAAQQAQAAQSMAEEAQTQADQAITDAEAAQLAADTATLSAVNAQNEADNAKLAADTAQGVADKAKADLEAAKKDLATVAGRVDATEEEIQAAQTAVNEAQSAADKAKSDADTAVKKAADAQSAADTAVSNATDAQEAAKSAINKANVAQAVAEAAQGDATAAQKVADDAKATATAAQAMANTAKTNADNAQVVANSAAADAAKAQKAADDADAKVAQAQTDLDTAKKNLAAVTSRVGATEAEVEAAQADVIKAQTAADNAKLEAKAAQSIADQAKVNAATAQAAADNAKLAADAAQTSANQAKAAADAAQKDVNALTIRVTTAETKITQNSEKIALMATKTEVTEALGGYYKKTETKSLIEQSASEVRIAVSSEIQERINDIEIGGRNLILNGKGDEKKGFFSNFATTTDGYMEATLTSKKQYVSINIAKGFVMGPREYPIGKYFIWSYDIMFTKWDFPEGTNRAEWWIGQRYTNAPSGETATGQWRGVTNHALPAVGSNGCELNEWYHVERKVIIPEQASLNVGTAASIQFYNSNSDVAASITFRLKNVKLEYGNKATDWTPAPEDIDVRISNAETAISNNSNEINLRATTETVTEISNKANEIDKTLENAKTLIQENRDAIATLTSRDFKVEFTAITNQINALNGDLTSYKEEIGNWMRFDADGNLVLGATRVAGQDAYELKLTKNRISFMLNDNEVAYISSNQLYITNSTVVQNLKIGGFTWEVRGNGNLGLVWR